MTVSDLIAQPLAYGLDLDSDEIDAALAAADLDPATCTPAEALTACQEFANAVQAFGQYPTRGGKRPNSGAPRGNSNAAKTDPKRMRNRQAKISQADTEHFAALGLARVTAALEALHTGEAIYMLISPEYASEIDEVIAHLEAVINRHRYKWHPSHTENTMRGLIAALKIAKQNI